MRTAAPLPAALVKLINDQGGAVSTAQLVALGLSEAVIRRLTRRWTTPARGVHIVGEPSWQGAVWAGLLRGGTGAVVGAEAACFLHKALRDEPRQILIWSGGGAKSGFTVGKWCVAYRRGTRRERGTPPRASLEDSLLDFARTAGELEIVSAISQAFAKRRTMPKKLRKALAKRGRLRHRELIQELCATDGVESVLEWLFLRDVLQRHQLPEPNRQASTEVGRVDGLYEQYGLVVELDGMRDHGNWSKDMDRDNEHVLTRDLVTMRYGFGAVTGRSCDVAAQLSRGLQRGGWTGSLVRCPACPENKDPDHRGPDDGDQDAKRSGRA